MLAVDDDVAIVVAAQGGNQVHAETQLRRPEPREVVAGEEMAGEPAPALQVLLPVGRRDQRQDGMVIAGAEDLDDAGVLQIPQQRPAVDDAVDATLEVGAGERLEQGAGERQVDASDVLVLPQRARDAVDRPQDLLDLPLLRVEQVLEVARWLVEVEDERELDVGHRPLQRAHRSRAMISVARRASSAP